MNGTLGAAALRLAGLAPRLLGWRPGDFWAATPAEIAAILQPPSPPREGMTAGELARLLEHDSNG